MSRHLLSILLILLGLEPIPAVMGWEAAYTVDRSPLHHGADTFPATGNLKSPINLTPHRRAFLNPQPSPWGTSAVCLWWIQMEHKKLKTCLPLMLRGRHDGQHDSWEQSAGGSQRRDGDDFRYVSPRMDIYSCLLLFEVSMLTKWRSLYYHNTTPRFNKQRDMREKSHRNGKRENTIWWKLSSTKPSMLSGPSALSNWIVS